MKLAAATLSLALAGALVAAAPAPLITPAPSPAAVRLARRQFANAPDPTDSAAYQSFLDSVDANPASSSDSLSDDDGSVTFDSAGFNSAASEALGEVNSAFSAAVLSEYPFLATLLSDATASDTAVLASDFAAVTADPAFQSALSTDEFLSGFLEEATEYLASATAAAPLSSGASATATTTGSAATTSATSSAASTGSAPASVAAATTAAAASATPTSGVSRGFKVGGVVGLVGAVVAMVL